MANFADFGKVVIFRILGVFLKARVVFRMFLGILIFDPNCNFRTTSNDFGKVVIFRRCFLERFFAQKNSDVVLESFSACFWEC